MPASTSTPEAEPPDPYRIAQMVSLYTRLSPSGEHQLRGACPFCRSKAFLVRPGHGTFHCLKCGEGGDARTFAIKARDL